MSVREDWLAGVDEQIMESPLQPPGRPARFHTGPVSLRTWLADVRYVRWAGREFVRRIFVTVRDDTWREVPPADWSCSATQDEGGLRLRLAARHDDEAVQFAWRGLFEVDARTGTMSFSFAGVVPRDAQVNRLGLAVVHPPQAMVGGSIVVSGPWGKESVELGEHIHPQPLANGSPIGMTAPFDTLAVSSADGTSMRLTFEGELFEIEDQRNFCDASFKSYCPPLREGFPRALAAGTRVANSVTCVASLPATAEARVEHIEPSKPSKPVDPVGPDDVLVLPQRGVLARFPQVGLRLAAVDPAARGWSGSPLFGYLRIDLPAEAGADALARLSDLLTDGQLLELGLVTGASGGGPADELIASIGADDRLARVLLFAEGKSLVDHELARSVCVALRRQRLPGTGLFRDRRLLRRGEPGRADPDRRRRVGGRDVPNCARRRRADRGREHHVAA